MGSSARSYNAAVKVSGGHGLTQGLGSSPKLMQLLAEFISYSCETHGGMLHEGHQKSESLTSGPSLKGSSD